MKLKKVLGYLLLASPFAIVGIASVVVNGWLQTLGVWLVVVGIVAVIWAGVALIHD